MKLSDFIQQALVQIAAGIKDANHELKDSSAIINPSNVYVHRDPNAQAYGELTESTPPRAVHLVNFDVVVAAESGTATKGGIGIVVGAIALGSQGKSDSSNTSQSQIQFSIPMVFPDGGSRS